jgi:putative iron-regulated protein
MRATKTLYAAMFLGLASATVITSCKKKSGCTDATATNYNPDADKNDGSCIYGDVNAALKQEIKANYANIVFASYEDAYTEAVKLQGAINTFLTTPNASNFETCKTAWKNSREPYGQTEGYRFANGPIDAEDGPEGMINAWPLDENYIDYVTGSATAGIINDAATYPTINKTLLESLN